MKITSKLMVFLGLDLQMTFVSDNNFDESAAKLAKLAQSHKQLSN